MQKIAQVVIQKKNTTKLCDLLSHSRIVSNEIKIKTAQKTYENLFRPSKSHQKNIPKKTLHKFGSKLFFFDELLILVMQKIAQVVSQKKIQQNFTVLLISAAT